MPISSIAPGLQAEVKTSGNSLPEAKKIVIAIHGIGDQYRNATIQSVVTSFGKFADYVATMPLGRLETEGGKKILFLRGPPPPQPPLDKIAFVELYWADIPRKVQKEGYRIEETKAWARTVVERLRARYDYFKNEAHIRARNAPGHAGRKLPVELHREDFFAAAEAIEEMIETFSVLDHLLAIAEKAGLLKFNLNDLLISYVGDVQIVADFPDQRRLILDQFSKLLHEVASLNPGAEIYLVAHSEGTVVAFMGLLEAMAMHPRDNGAKADKPPDWVRQVRGFMTIGSPIDKHLILWPDIWDDLQEQHPSLDDLRDNDIKWRNYFDYGDPVGFRLDTARDWIEDHGWKRFFEFEPEHDYGFGRYFFPGAAHIDYWEDEGVFGHFIQTVVKLKPAPPQDFEDAPGNKLWPRIGSWIVPYILVYLLLFGGVYLVYKGTVDYLFPPGHLPGHEQLDPHIRHFTGNVAGISALMMGMIALARIPRLTRRWTSWIAAIAGYATGAAFYAVLVEPVIKKWHTLGFLNSFEPWVSGAAVIIASFLVIAFAAWAGRQKLWKWTSPPFSQLKHFLTGTRPLLIPGAICVLGAVAFHVIKRDLAKSALDQPLWPLLLASAAFFYLWWLAILVFDLVFVWHRYIRRSVAQKYFTTLRRKAKGKNAPPHRSSPAM